MQTSCFFCQNLLSDFVEGILASSKYEELKAHLEVCEECRRIHEELNRTIRILGGVPQRQVPPDFLLRVTEAGLAGRHHRITSAAVSKWLLLACVPVLIFFALTVTFPQIIPPFWVKPTDEESFVRYYPLLHGAGEILEEQANWLYSKESSMRSVWEEGGLSTDEFEKAFQVGGGGHEP